MNYIIVICVCILIILCLIRFYEIWELIFNICCMNNDSHNMIFPANPNPILHIEEETREEEETKECELI